MVTLLLKTFLSPHALIKQQWKTLVRNGRGKAQIGKSLDHNRKEENVHW